MSDVKITDNSREVLAAFEQAKRNALEAIGARAETHAKALTPVDTGLLRNSITYAISGQPADKSSYSSDDGKAHGEYHGTAPNDKDLAVYIGTNVEYAPYIELGSRRNKSHHMLKKAATEHSEEYKAIAKAAFGK